MRRGGAWKTSSAMAEATRLAAISVLAVTLPSHGGSEARAASSTKLAGSISVPATHHPIAPR